MLLQILTIPLLATATLGRPQLTRRQDGPVDPSTASDCTWYDTAVDKSYDCEYFADQWGITRDDFVSYNPSVKEDCSGLKIGNSYCVEVNNGQPRPTSTTASSTASAKPSPTQSGLIDTCTTFYKAVAGDTCEKVVKKYGTFTEDEFIKWNPAVGDDCAAIWAKNYYCVGIPGTPSSRPSSTATSTLAPSPTQSGLIDSCTTFYKAVAGDTCKKVVEKYGTFTEDEFIKWNPAVGDDCSAIWAKNYYCVGIPGTPSSRPSSTATGTLAPSPTQSGLIDSCTTFYKAVAGDTCEKVVAKYGTFTEGEFIEWNPAVGDDCSAMWAKNYYCVGIPGTPTSRPATTTATSTGTTGPSPTQSGIIDTCARYYKAQAGDDCSTVVKQFGTFDLDDFLEWNPAVGDDCSAFWAKTYYCVGVPGTPTTPTTAAATQPTCASAPTPTQPGALCDCQRWHKVAKDEDCETIEKEYGISNADFAKWNSQVGTNCATLWLSYNVCVGA